MADIKMEISNLNQVIMQLNGQQKVLAKALEATTKDFKSRAPSKISKRIREVYGIKTADIKATQKGSRTNGTINVGGVSVDNVELVYSGRLLTPTHFNMLPKIRPTGKRYAVKATIKKGHRVVLSSRAFLAASGRTGSTQIPFQRTGNGRYPIQAIKTVSVPQMIANENDGVANNIKKDINDLLNTRLEHNLKRFEARSK